MIRVWSLKTMAPVAVLQGHTGMITSLQVQSETRQFIVVIGLRVESDSFCDHTLSDDVSMITDRHRVTQSPIAKKLIIS